MTDIVITPAGQSPVETGGCACCAAPAAESTKETIMTGAVSATSENTVTTTYTVSGMTCGHCVSSVTEELTALDGVTKVDVDLPTGAVTITSAAPLELDAVRGAVTEAGYELVA